MTAPELDLRAAFEQVFGPTTWDRPREWDGFVGEPPDLFVSDSEAERLQRQVDARLSEIWGPQV